MKQRTSLLSPAITALLLCGAFATPLAMAQTSHKHKKTTSTESTTTTDTGANASTSTMGTDTTATDTMSSNTTAQSATPPGSATPATPATPYPGTSTPATPATPANPADAAAASMGSASPRTMSWSDLDTDHNGNLSKSEASSLSSLSQVFDTADSNKDGSLTADEYRAYLKTQGK